MSQSPYATLGVAVDADEKTIRQAFRRLAAANHPDRGGDPRRMQEINDAYDLLLDPQRRAAWDAQGDNAERELLEDAKRVLQIQLSTLLENEQVPDLVEALRTNLQAMEMNARAARSGNQLKERYYARRLRAFKAPAAEGDFLVALIEQKLAAIAASNLKCDHALASLEIARKILDGYSYREDTGSAFVHPSAYSHLLAGR